jgi:hypothetical protein
MNPADLLTGWDGLSRWVWRTSFETSLLIGLVLALQALLTIRLPTRTRYLLSLLVLVRLLMPVIPAIAWSPWNIQPGPADHLRGMAGPRALGVVEASPTAPGKLLESERARTEDGVLARIGPHQAARVG